ncbi:MAG: hypothetical protein LIO59_02155, partial [Oscillospiraceae bacterium]|nr:hypothetical protein [Oscillospiraceae bacterium]
RFVAQELMKSDIDMKKFIKSDKIDVEPVLADAGDKPDNLAEMSHLRTIGLVNVPSDLDNDIDKI